jgi:hypothetical protein
MLFYTQDGKGLGRKETSSEIIYLCEHRVMYQEGNRVVVASVMKKDQGAKQGWFDVPLPEQENGDEDPIVSKIAKIHGNVFLVIMKERNGRATWLYMDIDSRRSLAEITVYADKPSEAEDGSLICVEVGYKSGN